MSKREAGLESLIMTVVVARAVVALLGFESLSSEAAGLVILTTMALNFEFTNGRNPSLRHLNPRSSMSSGLLLGAVTLPLVLSARLVQLLRCSRSSKVSAEAVERLRFDFWLALTCSTSTVMLLTSFVRKQIVGSWIYLTFLEYSTVGGLIIVMSKLNLNKNWMALSGGVYILGGKSLFSYFLRAFPSSGTLGEVILVVEGVVLYGANAAASSLGKLPFDSLVKTDDLDPEQHTISVLLQGTILGVLLVPFVVDVLYQILPGVLKRSQLVHFLEKGSREGLLIGYKAGLFYLMILLVILIAVPKWLHAIFGVQLSTVLWTVNFVFQQPIKRLLLCAYWVGVICAPLPHLYRISASGQVPKIMVRKYYHLMVVFMFVPALLFDATFLQLAFGVALAGFLVVEMIRVYHFPPFGHLIEKFMTAFTDQRDSGVLIISHFSLLLGCALPVWLNAGPGDRPLASFAGVLILGIGDTMASVIGYNFGSIRVSPTSKKTFEGTVAGIVSVLMCFLLLIPMLSATKRPAVAEEYLSLVAATIAGGVLEAYTLQLDNAFIPLIFYSLLCL